MKVLRKSAVAAVVMVILLVILVAPLPIPPDRVLSEESSPDGGLIAEFSWRPSGLLGLITDDNPWVYLTIRERESGDVVERHRSWGDVPFDAYSLLGHHVPWQAQ